MPVSSEAVLAVSGMSCQHCVNALHDPLAGSPEVRDARVDLDSGTVRVNGIDLDTSARVHLPV